VPVKEKTTTYSLNKLHNSQMCQFSVDERVSPSTPEITDLCLHSGAISEIISWADKSLAQRHVMVSVALQESNKV